MVSQLQPGQPRVEKAIGKRWGAAGAAIIIRGAAAAARTTLIKDRRVACMSVIHSNAIEPAGISRRIGHLHGLPCAIGADQLGPDRRYASRELDAVDLVGDAQPGDGLPTR